MFFHDLQTCPVHLTAWPVSFKHTSLGISKKKSIKPTVLRQIHKEVDNILEVILLCNRNFSRCMKQWESDMIIWRTLFQETRTFFNNFLIQKMYRFYSYMLPGNIYSTSPKVLNHQKPPCIPAGHVFTSFLHVPPINHK